MEAFKRFLRNPYLHKLITWALLIYVIYLLVEDKFKIGASADVSVGDYGADVSFEVGKQD